VSTFLLIAKAGGCAEAPENTCEAVARTVSLRPPTGCELAIEVDLRLSGDDQFVALHDATLERTTNGRGSVRRHSLRELCRLTAGSNAERVPALFEVLEAAGDSRLLLELHDDDVAAAAALARSLALVQPRQRERLWVASEHGRVMNALRRADPALRTAATKREAWGKLLLGRVGLARLAARGHVWVVPERHAGWQVVTPRFVEEARAAGDAVWVFVVDDAVALRRLIGWGVAGCLTTRPAELTAALAQL
jgi:glycerophosphoryl diester phosphodiesterase